MNAPLKKSVGVAAAKISFLWSPRRKSQLKIVLRELKTVKNCAILANFTPKLVEKGRFSRMHVVGCIQDVARRLRGEYAGFMALKQELVGFCALRNVSRENKK